jgi:methylmalonyl-CoA mutase C-terminal domain/subunit
MAKLREEGVTIPVVVGGTIPEQDIPALHRLGVRRVFLPNTPLEDVVQAVTAIVEQTQQEEAVG